QLLLEARRLRDRDAVEPAVDAGVDRDDLLLGRPRLVLRLVQRRDHPLAARGRLLRRSAELRHDTRDRRDACVAASSSERNCANASSSRYCARSRRRRPATFFIAFVCALPPTRDTEMRTCTARGTPEKKRSDWRKI